MGLCSVNDVVAVATPTKPTPRFQFNSNYRTWVPASPPVLYGSASQTLVWKQKQKLRPKKVQALFQLH